jgi:phytol kinase
MQKKLVFEFKRKFFHLFSLLYILAYFLLAKSFNHKTAIIVFVILLIVFILAEFSRLKLKKKLPLFDLLGRENEKNKVAGYVWFLAGVTIVFAFFDFNIAVAALLMTTFGDMSAALFGIAFGKHWLKWPPQTAWEGIIAQFVVDLIIGFIFINTWWIVVAMAFVATLAETFLIKIDDNFSIPVLGGLVAHLLSSI